MKEHGTKVVMSIGLVGIGYLLSREIPSTGIFLMLLGSVCVVLSIFAWMESHDG